MKFSRLNCLLVLGLGVVGGQFIEGACDYKRASQSVGACHTNVMTCSSHGNSTACAALTEENYFVKQDFPTSCDTTTTPHNCNQPLANCYRKTLCVWNGTVCNPVDPNENPNSWFQNAKKTTVFCGEGDPGDPDQ